MRIGVFFGSTSYGTKEAADLVRAEFAYQAPAAEVELRNVARRRAEDLGPYDLLVFGTFTWGLGGPQHDWDAFIWELGRTDLTGKVGAAAARGAAAVGRRATDGYAFDSSRSVRDGRFLSPALDRISTRALTQERVRQWVGQVLAERGEKG